MITNNNIILMSFIATLIKLLIARQVYKKNPSSNVNVLFSSIFLFQGLWDFGKALMWLSPDIELALIFAKVSYVCYIISVFIFPHFVWTYLRRKNIVSRHAHIWYIPMFILIILLFASNTVISSLLPPEQSTFGFGVHMYENIYGSAYNYFFSWFQAAVFFYCFFILLSKYFKTKFPEQKARLRFLLVGISFPIWVGIPTGVILPAMGYRIFPHNNILTSLMGLFIGYGIIKYKFLSIKPLHEASKLKVDKKVLSKFPVSRGNSYLVCSSTPQKSSFNILLDKLSKNNYGLIISPRKPSDIRKEYNLKSTPIVWITDTETDELSIGSNDVQQLYSTIDSFTKNIPGSFVLLDSLDYLIKKNSFSKMLFFVKNLNESVIKNKSILLIPAEKYELTKKQETMLIYEYRFLPLKAAKSLRLSDMGGMIKRNANFVALGYDSAIESLIKEVEYSKSSISVITPKVKTLKEKGVHFFEDNPLRKSTLEKHIKDSANCIIFISLENDSDTMLAINLVRSITEKARVIANIHRTSFKAIAEKAGADYVVASSTLGGHLLALSVNYPNTIRWIMEAVTRFGKGIELEEYISNKKTIGKTISYIDKSFGDDKNIIAVKNGESFKQIPEDSYKIQKGDILLVVKQE